MKSNQNQSVFVGVSLAMLIIAFVIFLVPVKTYGRTEPGAGNKQYVRTHCEEGGKKWYCNDCGSGWSTCSDNSCTDCKPAS